MNPLRYLHLLNPLYTTFHTGEGRDSAPSGSYALSDNPKLNLAIWNAIYSGVGAAGIVTLLSALSNTKAQNEIEDDIENSIDTRLRQSRPSIELTKNKKDDLLDSSVLKVANEQRNSSAGEAASEISAIIQGILYSSLPIIAPTAVGLGAKYLYQNLAEDHLKNKLRKQRDRIRESQSEVDREMLELQGLIAPGNMPKKANRDGDTKEFAPEPNQSEDALTLAAAFPVLASILLTTGLSAVAYNHFRKADKSTAKNKMLRKEIMPHDPLGETPKMGLAELPVVVEELVATPTATKKDTYRRDAADVEEFLEEVGGSGKKDALF
jgi:hypothetical protein